jgi:pyrroline-5-carboxylate reductase
VFEGISVTDPVPEKLSELAAYYPEIVPSDSAADLARGSDIIVLAVHPPVFADVLAEIKGNIGPDKLIVSLSPKITIAKMQEILGQNVAVARVIPNAPSVIGKGYNAYAVSEKVHGEKLQILKSLLQHLGMFVSVEENKLEAYATFAGMGPTYLWFLFQELYQQSVEYGLSEKEARMALNAMVQGASETLFNSDLSFEQVLDLIPAYPLRPMRK